MEALTAFERFKERIVGKVDAARGRCWLLHAWGPWRTTGGFTIQRRGMYANDNIGSGFYQARECTRCGKGEVGVSKVQAIK